MDFVRHPISVGTKTEINTCVYEAPRGFAKPLLYRNIAKLPLYRALQSIFFIGASQISSEGTRDFVGPFSIGASQSPWILCKAPSTET